LPLVAYRARAAGCTQEGQRSLNERFTATDQKLGALDQKAGAQQIDIGNIYTGQSEIGRDLAELKTRLNLRDRQD
jgi:hypothetical protein